MKQKKIYTVVVTSTCESGIDTHVWTFTNKKDAKKILNAAYKSNLSEIDKKVRQTEKHPEHWEIWEKNSFLNNSLTGTIYLTTPNNNEWDSNSICF